MTPTKRAQAAHRQANADLRKHFAAYRKDNPGVNLRNFAERIGTSKQFTQRWTTGKSTAAPALLAVIAEQIKKCGKLTHKAIKLP